MKKILAVILLFIVFQQTSFGQFGKYTSFDQMDSLWIRYMLRHQLDSATLVYEYARKAFPGHDEKITSALGFLYTKTNRDSLALAIWSYGQQKGYYFGLNNNIYKAHFKDNKDYIKLAGRDKQIGDSLNNLSHIKYEVKLPKNYSKDSAYPLLFVFHGNGGSLKSEKAGWSSKVMNDNFITIYVQSYIHGFFNEYDWHINDEKSRKEISELYHKILQEYPVKKDKIYFLGFSAGGGIAIDLTFNEVVPVSGLILNCPDVPGVSDDAITEFVKKGRKFVIITGEKDWDLNNQNKLISRIDSADGIGKIIINKGIGHQFPNDFSDLLDKYLTWINE